MRFLIDTNILIQLEDNIIIGENFSSFFKLAISNNCKVLYHPEAIPKDISRDNNEDRKNIILSKLVKYEKLEDPATPDLNFQNSVPHKKINDEIDNIQLYQIHRGFVDFFVTQDKGIHKTAKNLSISNVITIEEAVEKLDSHFRIKIPQHPILEEHSIRDIESYFNSPFFDSLRDDYGETSFNNWLNKCIVENRKCYSLIVEKQIRALLIYNIEDISDHQIPNIFDKALKICTLKVASDAFGINWESSF